MKRYDEACIIIDASICTSLYLTHSVITYDTAWTVIAYYESLLQLIVDVCIGEYKS